MAAYLLASLGMSPKDDRVQLLLLRNYHSFLSLPPLTLSRYPLATHMMKTMDVLFNPIQFSHARIACDLYVRTAHVSSVLF